ncbi:MAG TPA: VWA domain-containing protein [Limnochordales bacterium]
MSIPIPEPFLLLAVEPALQGVYLFGPPAGAEPPLGTVARRLTDGPVVRVPASITPEQLDERLDVHETLAGGRPVYRPGLVERARLGALVVEAADLLSAPAAAFLASLVEERPTGQRPLVLARSTTRPRPADPIAARCALWVDVTAVAGPLEPGTDPPLLRLLARENACATPANGGMDGTPLGRRLAAARAQLARISLPNELLEDICRRVGAGAGAAQCLDYYVACAARARAAWYGRAEILGEDVTAALRWIVEPRRGPAAGAASPAPAHPPASKPEPAPAHAANASRQPLARPGAGQAAPANRPAPAAALPMSPAASPDPPGRLPASPAGLPGPSPGGRDGGRNGQRDGVHDPRVVVLPPAALAGTVPLPGAALPRRPPASPHRAGTARSEARPSPRRLGSALALVPTLLAAIPYQRLRAPRPPLAVRVLPDDLRWRRRRPKPRPLYILAVDGSGSMAHNRMHLAKGAAISVLQGAYRERRHVALIDFRHRSAHLLCPPGRSTALIRRRIGALPNAGGTPLPAALALSLRLVQRWRLRHPDSPVRLVLFTDGKANVPLLDGERSDATKPMAAPGDGRRQAWADVERMGALLRAAGVDCTLIDTAPPGTAEALHRLARCLGAGIIRLASRHR